MKRWSRKNQKDKFLKRNKKLSQELGQLKEKEVFYLNSLNAAENAACSDAIEPCDYSPELES